MNLADKLWAAFVEAAGRLTQGFGGRLDFQAVENVELGAELSECFGAGGLVRRVAGMTEEGRFAEQGGGVGFLGKEIGQELYVVDGVCRGCGHQVVYKARHSFKSLRFILVLKSVKENQA